MPTFANNQIVRLSAAALMAAGTGDPVVADGFDQDKVGVPPAAWTCGTTGGGSPVWAVRSDPTAPSKPNVLLQSGKGAFPWCVMKSASISDGFVEVMFKPVDGKEDQAGGVVWRWKDAGHYYVARANALENNVSLYYMEGGARRTLQYVAAPVAKHRWASLRVEFSGKRIRVLLDGQSRIEIDDEHIADAGSVGLWTKADSVTAFDNFVFGEIRVRP